MDKTLNSMENKLFDLYSFDIFDTLVTRKVASAEGIFAIVQEKIKENPLFDENFKNNFGRIRTDAEFFAREDSFAANNHKEIKFERIYDKIKERYKLSDEQADVLKSLELETEKENLIPIKKNINKLLSLLEENKQVVLISDMYFSEVQLKEILENVDPIFSKVKIYVSSENKCSKYDGKLYSVVSDCENASYKNWKHFGDNKISDFKNPNKLGIKAELFDFPSLKTYEKAVLDINRFNIDWQFAFGCSRNLRFNTKHENQDKYEFGSSFAGIFLYNYVNYVLEQTIEKGFRTLYFVARDGYIPKQIADIIIQKKGLEIKTKYLFGSRLAWRIPTENNYEIFINDILKEYPQKVSLSYLAYRLHISTEKLLEIFDFKNANKIIPCKKHEHIFEKLCEQNTKNFVISENQERKDLLIRYLKQEIDFSENEIVFVDATGSGKSQNILTEIMQEIKEVKTYGFYLATSGFDNSVQNAEKDLYLKEQKPHYHYAELLCKTNLPQTTGYKENGEEILPVFEETDTNVIDLWGYGDYFQGICDFTNNIAENKKFFNYPEMCYTYIDYMTTKCDSEVSKILGSMPVATIGRECKLKKAAPKLSIKLFLYMVLLNKKPEDLTEFPYLMMSGENILSNIIKKLRNGCTFLQYLKLLFVIKKHQEDKIVLWGASLFLEDFIKIFNIKSENVVGIVDKNPNRQGQSISKYKIFSPEEIEKLNPNCIVLTIKNRNEMIYYDVQKYLSEKHPNIVLLPNIFV